MLQSHFGAFCSMAKSFEEAPRKGAPRMCQSGGGLRRISMGTDEFKVQVG